MGVSSKAIKLACEHCRRWKFLYNIVGHLHRIDVRIIQRLLEVFTHIFVKDLHRSEITFKLRHVFGINLFVDIHVANHWKEWNQKLH